MIHKNILNELLKEQRHNDFIHPAYGGSSIAEIPISVLEFFGIKADRPTLKATNLKQLKADRLLFFLVDGLGYSHFTRAMPQSPFLTKLAVDGDLYPLTSVFPSTTSAALTTLHSGLTPQEHGLPEWHVYFEEFDSIVATLPFRLMNSLQTDSLTELGGKGTMLYEGPTVYEQLAAHDIPSFMFILEDYAGTVYSSSVHRGSMLLPFRDGPDLMRQLIDKLPGTKGPAYFFVYWGKIDSIAHQYGPNTPEHLQSIQQFTALVEHEFLTKITPEDANDTLVLLSADHGHVDIKGDELIYLNRYPIIGDSLERSKNNRLILPSGSPHDVFLYIKPEKLHEVAHFFKSELKNKAEVLLVNDAIKLGLFGINSPSATFKRRIGNLLILPRPGHHVWYEFFPSLPFEMLGIHGGLTQDEMMVPLGVAPLTALL